VQQERERAGEEFVALCPHLHGYFALLQPSELQLSSSTPAPRSQLGAELFGADPTTWTFAARLERFHTVGAKARSRLIKSNANPRYLLQFFPTFTRTLGYSNTVSFLLCAPSLLLRHCRRFRLMYRHSDKTQERWAHVMVPLPVGIVGFIIAMSTQVWAARYGALFLMAQVSSEARLSIE